MTQNEFEVAMSKLKAAECGEINDVMLRVEELDKEKRALLEEVRGLKGELDVEVKEELDVEVKEELDVEDVKEVV